MKVLSCSLFPGLHALQSVYESHVHDCTRCDRSQTRKQVLFGQGWPERPALFLLGGAPTLAQELRRSPYAGEGGAFLRQALGDVVDRVYYAHVVCCRSKKQVTGKELEACFPVVLSQVIATQPKSILCLGDTPTRSLLKTDRTASELRGRWHLFEGCPVLTTHGLSEITQGCPQKKAEFEGDVQKAINASRATSELV